MNSTFQKTLIATALSAILSTTAMAAEEYSDTIDGGTNEEKILNQHQQNKSGHDNMPGNQQGMTNGKMTSDNDKNLTYSSDEDNSENRNKSKHQDDVLGKKQAKDNNQATDGNNSNVIDQNLTYGSDEDNSENRNKSKHQDSVLGENTEKGQGNNSYRSNADNMSSEMTALYSMSADDLTGMEVVDTNGDEIGNITGVVLTQDRESAHAVINLGGFLGLGGRDVLASLDQLTMADDKLRLHANQRQIESMTDYGSANHVDLEGDAKVSSEIHNH